MRLFYCGVAPFAFLGLCLQLLLLLSSLVFFCLLLITSWFHIFRSCAWQSSSLVAGSWEWGSGFWIFGCWGFGRSNIGVLAFRDQNNRSRRSESLEVPSLSDRELNSTNLPSGDHFFIHGISSYDLNTVLGCEKPSIHEVLIINWQ